MTHSQQTNTMEDTNTPETNRCNRETEVYSRVVGFYRPVKQWNNGKKEEFDDRQEFEIKNLLNKE